MKTQNSPLANKSHVIVLITALSLIIIVSGYLFYKHQESSIRQQKYNELKAIADLKVSQIEEWLKARHADVISTTQSAFFVRGINQWLKDTGNVQLKQDIIEPLRLIVKEHEYENIFLVAPNGSLLLSVKTELEEFHTLTKQKIIEASEKGEIVFTDFYCYPTENTIYYDILAPITNGGKNTIAILLFRRDPNNYLYPLIQTWPTPSQSSETAILRVEKDSVLFLNELRHRKNTALRLRIPLTRTEVPSVQAAFGRTGLFEGVDYRGVEVLSDIRVIPANNWIMLSKVDKSEIYADLYLSAGIISGFSIFLIIICGIGLAFIYKSRQKNIFMELYNKEKELWQNQERFKVTMDSLGDGVITTDIKGTIQYLNMRAEELTGWNLREARGRSLSEIYSVKNEDTGQKENNILEKVIKHGIVKELANHTILITKSGKEIPVTDTGAPIFDVDGSSTGVVITFQDETDERQRQKLLKENEARLQEAQRIAKLGNWELDLQTMTPIWSLQTYRIHEVDPSVKPDLKGAINFYAPEARPIITESINRCIQEGTPWNLELPFITATGKHIWVCAQGEAESRDGKCVRLFGTFQDITERKQAEEKIIKANRVYAVISQINQMIVQTRNKDELFREACRIAIDSGKFQMAWIGLVDERTLLVNPVVHSGVEDGYLSTIKKISISDVPEGQGPTGTAIREGKHFVCDDIENDPRMATWKDEALKRGYRSSIAMPIKLFGKVIGAFSLYAPVSHFFDQEEIVLLDEVTNDISFALETIETEKRRIEGEEALRKSEERFRLISENVADLIAVLDLEGRRVYNSPMYKNIIGDPNELRGTDSFQEIHPYDRDRIKAIFQETVRTGIGQRAEYRFMKKDGTIFHIESQGSVIRDKDGKITNVVVVSRDVTEKKLLEQQFMRMQRMESIGTLAGGVAHDLNNVLAPILLSIEILKRSILDERSQKIFETLEASTRRGSEIVKQILGFARGVEGERTLLQLRHIIEDTISIIKETFPKSISIRHEIPKNIWTILGDSTQLHQVIMNLCINARDAMPNGGIVKIFAENKIIDEQYARMHIEAIPGHYMMISIEDTGTGMPPDVVDHIFEPFFTTKERGKGTGLGLSTVHTIVKSHNGFINVYSEVGKGTTFKIYIPAAETEQVKASGFEIKDLLSGNGELILVVDDEASICEITKQTLETFGYRAITACDGTEALAIYASQGKDIALVITDMTMPIMDGARTIHALRKMNPSVKIIASSGLTGNGHVVTDKELGVNTFITKPYTAEKLLEVVHLVLHKK
ncbi:MAG: PAS domain S-box protein [Bacteroidota bacterium]|nr:PAS domain S-box protein [Bacteroidota bacterium]